MLIVKPLAVRMGWCGCPNQKQSNARGGQKSVKSFVLTINLAGSSAVLAGTPNILRAAKPT